MPDDAAEVVFLIGSPPADRTAQGLHCHFFLTAGIAGRITQLLYPGFLQVQIDQFGGQDFVLGQLVQVQQQAPCSAGGPFLALNRKKVAAAENLNARAGFDLFEVLIELPTQVCQAQCIRRFQFQG